MLLLSSVVVGVTVGSLLGGSLAGLADLRVRHWPLLFGALVAQVAVFSPPLSSSGFMLSYGLLIYQATLIATLLVMALNLSLRGMKVLLLGSALNALVIVANGGQMPVDRALLAQAVTDLPAAEDRGFYLNTAPMTASTRLSFLGDVLLVPEPLPLRNVFSAGDALIAIGAAVLVVFTMKRPAIPATGAESPGHRGGRLKGAARPAGTRTTDCPYPPFA